MIPYQNVWLHLKNGRVNQIEDRNPNTFLDRINKIYMIGLFGKDSILYNPVNPVQTCLPFFYV